MKTNQFTTTAIAVLSATMAFVTFAQGPVGDEFKVTFDRSIQVGSQTLPPGNYTVKQVTSASNPRVLEFKTDDDNKLVATVTAIPVMQNTPPSETKVILQDEGGGARLSRIMVQGRTYGYGFPGQALPASQSTTASAQLSGSYSGAASTVASADRTTETAPATPPVETPARNEAVATPAPTPTPEATAQAPVSTTPTDTTPDVPATGLGWVDVVAVGLTMSAAGLLLYKREARRS
jgi:hypothetical protein